jgi:hypothetical protein
VVHGDLPDFERIAIADAQAFPSRQIISSRLFTTQQDAEASRQKYLTGTSLQFKIKASLFADVQESKSSVRNEQVSIKKTNAFTDLDGSAPAFQITGAQNSVSIDPNHIPLTRNQLQDFQGALSQEITQQYTIQDPTDLQFLQSQLDKALSKVTTPKDISSDFGTELAGMRAYGFNASDLKPDEVDNLVSNVQQFFRQTASSTFSASASGSFMGIGASGSMSMSQLKDQMTAAGWNFQTQGIFTIPKSLTINVLDKTALNSLQDVTISITRTTSQVVSLETVIDSGVCFAPESSTSADVGQITASALDFDSMPNQWKMSYAPCDGRDLPDTCLYVIARRKVIAAGKGWAGEVNPQTQKIRASDFRGVFLRGLDSFSPTEPPRNDAYHDPDQNRVVGSMQMDSVGPHKHKILNVRLLEASGGKGFWGGGFEGGSDQKDGFPKDIFTSDNLESPLETRPKNGAVYYYLRIN